MNAAAYQPREGSVAWKVIEFLTTNPEESLTADDASAKFDVSAKAVHSSLGPAVRAGVLTRTEDPDSGDLVYRRGNGVPANEPTPTPDAVGVAIAGPLPHRRGDGYLDTAAIQIEKNVPLAPKCGGRQAAAAQRAFEGERDAVRRAQASTATDPDQAKAPAKGGKAGAK